MTDFPTVMAAGDVKNYLGVSYQYVEKLADTGKLRYQQTSSGKIFLQQDVVDFKKKRAIKAKTDGRIKGYR